MADVPGSPMTGPTGRASGLTTLGKNRDISLKLDASKFSELLYTYLEGFDERNYLYIEQMRLVKELNPKVSIIENVKGFMSMKLVEKEDQTEEIVNKYKQLLEENKSLYCCIWLLIFYLMVFPMGSPSQLILFL